MLELLGSEWVGTAASAITVVASSIMVVLQIRMLRKIKRAGAQLRDGQQASDKN
ncbi:hypothetical protein [Nonomuraea sp. NPDC049695]|uniref:hypothetical protein n=1 Tax=Nonomuraea sp. NPDC049695 TaxID=3154734 RepID=UPI003428A9D1